jgi:hypothetical protein
MNYVTIPLQSRQSVMDLKAWHDFAELMKPILECVAIIAGASAVVKWFSDRNNRATDVLLALEREFESKCKHGRPLVEEDLKYKKLAELLTKSVKSRKRIVSTGINPANGEGDLHAAIDDFLRFYVLLIGVRIARQVPERSLSTCYRFWMAHYYRNDRQELRQYINMFFPTLKSWLLRDTCWSNRLCHCPISTWWRPFFRPEDFWDKKEFENDPQKLDPHT